MKRWGGAFLLLLLVACGREQPAYESTSDVVTPSPLGSPPAVTGSFIDTFDRADRGWDLRGPYAGGFPLPAATDGFIKDGRFTYAGNAVVYAVRQFHGQVRKVGARGQWRRIREGDADTAMTMALTANDKIVSDMVHFSVSRSRWSLTVRRGADFIPVAEGQFAPVLLLDHEYEFEVEATAATVTVRVPGDEATPKIITTKVNTAGLLGNRAFWEEFPVTTPADVVFDYNTVWAAEAGRPVKPVD
jgi:hypothetical protein